MATTSPRIQALETIRAAKALHAQGKSKRAFCLMHALAKTVWCNKEFPADFNRPHNMQVFDYIVSLARVIRGDAGGHYHNVDLGAPAGAEFSRNSLVGRV